MIVLMMKKKGFSLIYPFVVKGMENPLEAVVVCSSHFISGIVYFPLPWFIPSNHHEPPTEHTYPCILAVAKYYKHHCVI